MALTGHFRFTSGLREHRAPPDWLYAIRAKKGEKSHWPEFAYAETQNSAALAQL